MPRFNSKRLGPISAAIQNQSCLRSKNAYRGQQRRYHASIRVDGDVAYVTFGGAHIAILDSADLPLVEGNTVTRGCRRSGLRDGPVRIVQSGGRSVSLASLIIPPPPGYMIDHIDGNSLNNRRSNLRIATPQQNAMNMAAQTKPKTSKFKGVCRTSNSKTWRSQITHNGRIIYLGTFVTQEAAARAYDAAARDLFGEFACVNFPIDGEQSAHRSFG